MQTETLNPKIRSSNSHLSRGRVLLVDDEEDNRTLLSDSLEAHRYEIIQAHNGYDALEKIAAQPADVVLLDLMMPGMDGFEVCRRLKKNPATASIPVLLITALSERQERLMGIAAGANDFLNKPVDIQDVILRVGNAVQSKRLFDELQAERRNSERLLLNILPARIAQRMKEGETDIAEKHADVTVLMADLVGFTTMSALVPPHEIVSLLSEIFSAFDALVKSHGLEKIKTIGDAYMVAGGIESPNPWQTSAVADLALAMKRRLEEFNISYNTSFRIRIGISAGPVVAGVIGRQRFAYDIWGETVNLACHLESRCAPGAIYVSEAVYDRLQDHYRFGKLEIELKGGSRVTAYQLSALRAQ